MTLHYATQRKIQVKIYWLPLLYAVQRRVDTYSQISREIETKFENILG
jgi:hypothetical protein